MSLRRAVLVGCIVLVGGIGCTGCTPRAKTGAATPTDAAVPGESSPDAAAAAPPMGNAAEPTLAELQAELEGYERRLHARGVHRVEGATGKKKPKTRTNKDTGGEGVPATAPAQRDACEDVCELATAICGLRDRICTLAGDHDDEPSYAEACTRAEADCDRASEACDDCS